MIASRRHVGGLLAKSRDVQVLLKGLRSVAVVSWETWWLVKEIDAIANELAGVIGVRCYCRIA